MAEVKDPTRVVTGICTFNYLNCLTSRSVHGGPSRYSVQLLVPKDDSDSVERINAGISAAYEKGLEKLTGDDPVPPALSDIRSPLHDGDLDHPEDNAYRGQFYLNAYSRVRPECVDDEGQPITSAAQLYNGIKGRASIAFYAYRFGSRAGIGCALSNLQKVYDGPRIGGGRSMAGDDFSSGA